MDKRFLGKTWRLVESGSNTKGWGCHPWMMTETVQSASASIVIEDDGCVLMCVTGSTLGTAKRRMRRLLTKLGEFK